MTKRVKVGVDLQPNTLMISRQIDQLEMIITFPPKYKDICVLPCITPPDHINVESGGNCYRYNFYHSNPELHLEITAVDKEFKVQIVVGKNSYINPGKDITDCITGLYACDLSKVMKSDYKHCKPGIIVYNGAEMPLYVIQVDIDYSRGFKS